MAKKQPAKKVVKPVKKSKIDWKKLDSELDADYKLNGEVLDDIFPKEAQDYLQMQERHDTPSKDPKGILTTLYGVTDNGCKTAAHADDYVLVPGGVPAFVKNAWDILQDPETQKQNPQVYDKLARRVSQYHAWTKSAMFDGWTNGNFSRLPAMTRYATLIQYNSSGGQKLGTSLTTQAIRLNNPALIAKSFYSSGRRDDTGAWAVAENGLKEMIPWAEESDKAYKNMANAKLIFSDEFPDKDQYRKNESASRVNGKGAVKDDAWKVFDATLNRLMPYYYINQDLSQAPEDMEYRKPEAFQPRKEQDNIVGVIDPTKQTGNIQKTSSPQEFQQNNAAELQAAETARQQAVSEVQAQQPQPQNAWDVFVNSMKSLIDFTKPSKKLLNTKNEVNNVNSRNANDNMQ